MWDYEIKIKPTKHTQKNVGLYTWGGWSCFSPLWHLISRGFVLCGSGTATAISLQSTTDGKEENCSAFGEFLGFLLLATYIAWEIKQPNERAASLSTILLSKIQDCNSSILLKTQVKDKRWFILVESKGKCNFLPQETTIYRKKVAGQHLSWSWDYGCSEAVGGWGGREKGWSKISLFSFLSPLITSLCDQ